MHSPDGQRQLPPKRAQRPSLNAGLQRLRGLHAVTLHTRITSAQAQEAAGGHERTHNKLSYVWSQAAHTLPVIPIAGRGHFQPEPVTSSTLKLMAALLTAEAVPAMPTNEQAQGRASEDCPTTPAWLRQCSSDSQ